jgi:predicted dehydrogenase
MSIPQPPPRLRLGMVGGGRGAFIGEAHRIATRIGDRYEFVAGALSLDSYKAIESGRDLRLDPMRCYTDYRGMAQAEATRPDGAQVVSVVTPNVSHHPICKTFLEAGIDVICDKPLTTTLAEAKDLQETVRRTGRFLGVTYNYSAYPLMREARALIEAGVLGAVRVVQVEFALGWLSIEDDSKQARWRTDPAQSGPSLVVADLGTHCFHLAEFVTQRRVSTLAADLTTMVPGRQLEDNAQIALHFDNGARGGSGLSPAARRAGRLVPGLPEGYHDAFATLYGDYADILTARRAGVAPDPLALWAPTVEDGVRGMAFVEAALRSQAEGGAWTPVEESPSDSA